MPVIKITDLAYGRLRSPDLDKQEEFLTAFGMVRADRTKKALYMRGTDTPHHIHVTELGPPKYSASRSTPAAWRTSKSSPAPRAPRRSRWIDEPGGGKRARLTDPDGFQVEVSMAWHSSEDRGHAAGGEQGGRQDPAAQRALLQGRRARPDPTSSASATLSCTRRSSTRRSAGTATCSAFSAPTKSMTAARTISSARSTGSTAATTCRPPRLFLHPQRQGGAQPPCPTKPPTWTTS